MILRIVGIRELSFFVGRETRAGSVELRSQNCGAARTSQRSLSHAARQSVPNLARSALTPSLITEQAFALARYTPNMLSKGRVERLVPTGPTVASAVAVDASHVRVSFDGRHFADLKVRSSATSSAGSQEIHGDGTQHSGGIIRSAARDLYTDFDNGVKTAAWSVKVHVQGR